MRYSITLKLFFLAEAAAAGGSALLVQASMSPAHSHKIGVDLIKSFTYIVIPVKTGIQS
jgi:hypothetical protein